MHQWITVSTAPFSMARYIDWYARRIACLMQKRQRLEALVDLDFKPDLANLLADGLELDPNEASDAAIAHQLLENGLKDLATVKAVTGGKVA